MKKKFTDWEIELINKGLRVLMIQEIELAFNKNLHPDERNSHHYIHDEASELLVNLGGFPGITPI